MKYVSKKEILKIPLIGWPMKLAQHIPLQTESRRSQLETFKDTVKSLEDGNSVITFPEGGRSIDGRIMAFKRGPFKMALRAQVPDGPSNGPSDAVRCRPRPMASDGPSDGPV